MRYYVFVAMLALCIGCGSRKNCQTQKQEYETGSVDAACQAMKDAGFKSVRAIVCGGERPVVDTIRVGAFTFRGIRYTGGVFKDRYAIAEVIDGAGNTISRFDELLLILEGKIPNSGYGGGWLQTREYDFKDFKANVPAGMTVVSMTFLYDTTGAKSTKIGEWNGFPIYHVTNDGRASYFAVEKAGNKVTCYPYE